MVASSIPDATGLTRIDLDIDGMTCASCAARVEKRLNKVEGVTATVNYATERAVVSFPDSVTPQQLISQVEAAGYGAHLPIRGPEFSAADEAAVDAAEARQLVELKTRVIVAAALALPVIGLAMIPALQFDNWQWVSLALTTPIVTWCAWPFHVATWKNLRVRAATMDTLITVGALAAYGWSLYALVFGGAGATGMTMDMGFTSSSSMSGSVPDLYFEAAASVTAFVLAGRYAEARAKRRSGAALRALLELGAKDATVIRDGRESLIPIGDLVVGDRFIVRPGEKLATDGVVEEGVSTIDESLMTGESVPVEVAPGRAVAGSTVNAGGRLVVRATRVGLDTQLAQMGRLIVDAQSGKSDVQRLADRVSAVFVPVVIAISFATLIVWLLAGASSSKAFGAAVAVLIIACPCALGLATPTALLVGTGRGAQLGLLITGPEAMESTRRIDTVVLDKTGTVTTGVMSVVGGDVFGSRPLAAAWRDAAALELASEHPVARAVVRAGLERCGLAGPEQLPAVEHFASTAGFGVEGEVEGRTIAAGRVSWLVERGVEIAPEIDAARRAAEHAGHTVVVVAWDNRAEMVVSVADAVKPTSAAAIAELVEMGLRPVLLTGDNEAAARSVASEVGIDEVIAGVRPDGKLEVVRRLQSEGHVVAMVGDGVNDAAAIVQADLGLAMGSGTDASIQAGDMTLMHSDLLALPDAIRLARRTLGTIRANLFWAFAYNVAAIPVAAMGWLNPAIAGAAMAFSSVFVVTNSLRLRRFQPRSSGTVRLAAND